MNENFESAGEWTFIDQRDLHTITIMVTSIMACGMTRRRAGVGGGGCCMLMMNCVIAVQASLDWVVRFRQ